METEKPKRKDEQTTETTEPEQIFKSATKAEQSNESGGKGGKFKSFFKKKPARIAACVLALFCAFFGGFFTHKATLPKEINSLLWAKERIQKDYLYEISDEEFYVEETRYPYGEENKSVVKLHKASFTEHYVTYRSSSAAYVYPGADATETEKRFADGGAFVLRALPEDTAYIRLTQFNGNAAAEFDGAMKRFSADGKKNLVLDLRGNGGGDMEILRSIVSYFCKTATGKTPAAAKAVYRDGKTYVFDAKRNDYSAYFGADGKAYVLADAGTASASECLLGAMLDYGGTEYGRVCLTAAADGTAKTYGKGIMQTTRTRFLWRSEAIKLTSAQICWPVAGKCIHGVGITTADGCKSVAASYAPDGEISAGLAALGITAA